MFKNAHHLGPFCHKKKLKRGGTILRYDFMAGARIVPKNRPSDRKKKRVCVRYIGYEEPEKTPTIQLTKTKGRRRRGKKAGGRRTRTGPERPPSYVTSPIPHSTSRWRGRISIWPAPSCRDWSNASTCRPIATTSAEAAATTAGTLSPR